MSDCMKMTLGCLLVWCAAGSFAAADEPKLEIRAFEAVYDVLGPVRKDASYFPGERLCCRYQVHGCGLNEAGRAELEVSCQIADNRGRMRTAFTNTINGITWKCAGAFVPVKLVHQFPDDLPPGQYRLEISIEDKLTKQTVSHAQPLTIKPVRLALVSPRCHYDARREIAAPFSGLVEQKLFLSAEVIGEDRTQGKIALNFLVELLDAKGKNMLREKAPFEMKSDDAAFIENPRRHAVMNAALPLLHPGKYTLRLSVADQFAGATAELTLPVEVVDPSEPGVLAAR